MLKTVVKHSYVKGRHGKDRSRAHINYISHREGPDREKGGRKFFDKERDELDAREVKQRMYETADERGVAMHKIILSPGLNTDAKEYTRELMERLEHIKGQELEWRAVVHENTKHQHVHVVLMSKDKDGHNVRIDREDHNKLRQFGDEYLDREHKLERYLDRELQDLVRSREYERGGDLVFQTIFGKQRDNRDDDPDRVRREFEEIDEKLRKSFEDKISAELYPKPWDQRRIEQAGRLSEHHYDYTDAMARERLEEIAKEHPERAEQIAQELDYMREMAIEDRSSRKQDNELDRILGWGDSGRDKAAEQAADSFENDRVAKPEQQDRDAEEQRDEREDFDPWAG